MNSKTIGDAIRNERKKCNITQKELAERLGVSASMIAQYETGKRKPKLETMRKLAEALGVPMGDLVANWSDYSTSEIITDLKEDSRTDHLNRQARLIARYYEELNALGQSKAIEQVEMLTKIPEYQKEKDDN